MPPPPPVSQDFSAPAVGTMGKKGFPKKIVLILLAVFLIFAFVFAAVRFLGTEKRPSGEIVWWGLWEEESTISPLIAEYQQQNPKVTVKYVKQAPQDYRERLINSLARGAGPDIFSFHNSWGPMFAEEFDSLPAAVMSAGEYSQTFYSSISSDLINSTGIIGIPIGYDAIVLYVNEDIFSSLGKTPPATWDDLRQVAIELTQKDEEGTILQAGVSLGRTENVDHWPEILALMMIQNEVDLSNPTGKLAEDALTFYTLFSSVDGVWDETLPPSTVAFAAGKLAMYFGPSWRAFEINQQNPELKFSTVAVPQLPKSSGLQDDVSFSTYWANGVWARSPNKEIAWDFLKFISSADSLEKIYQNASRTRAFGQPYPRVDMGERLAAHPVVGAVIAQAPYGRSWYLSSRTFDGPTGINSQIIKYFEDAVNAVNSGTPATRALEPVSAGVLQVLSQYGILR